MSKAVMRYVVRLWNRMLPGLHLAGFKHVVGLLEWSAELRLQQKGRACQHKRIHALDTHCCSVH